MGSTSYMLCLYIVLIILVHFHLSSNSMHAGLLALMKYYYIVVSLLLLTTSTSGYWPSVYMRYQLITSPWRIILVEVSERLLTRWSSWSSAAEHWPQRPAARWAGRADSSPRGPAAARGPPRPSRRASARVWAGLGGRRGRAYSG